MSTSARVDLTRMLVGRADLWPRLARTAWRAAPWAVLLLAISVVIASGPRWPALIGQAGWGCSYCLPPNVLPVATAPGALCLSALTALMVHLVPLLISLRGSSIYLDRVTIGGLFALLALLASWILRLPRVLAWSTPAVIWVSQVTGLVADYYVPDLRQDWRGAVAAVEARQPAGALAFVKPADFLGGAVFYSQPDRLAWRGLDDLGALPYDRPTSLWVIWGEREMPDRAGLAAHLPACFSLGDVDTFPRLTVFEVRRNANCIQEPHAIP